MKAEQLRERAAHLAEITILLPAVKSSYRAEEVMELLGEQRAEIANRIRSMALDGDTSTTPGE